MLFKRKRESEERRIMVKKTKDLFQCQECRMLFREKAWAEKCEAWCAKHHTCNIEIIKHAVKLE
jgi:hypothetical protein